MPDDSIGARIHTLELRVSALEEQLEQADEAFGSVFQTDLEHGIMIIAVIRALEDAGILRKGQMKEEIAKTRQSLVADTERAGKSLLAFFLKGDESPEKPQ